MGGFKLKMVVALTSENLKQCRVLYNDVTRAAQMIDEG